MNIHHIRRTGKVLMPFCNEGSWIQAIMICQDLIEQKTCSNDLDNIHHIRRKVKALMPSYSEDW